jgi:hypothetical protein
MHKNVHCRPGEYGPEGASDSPKPSPSDKPKEAQDFMGVNTPAIKDKLNDFDMLLPERDSVGSTNRTSEHASPQKPPSIQRMYAGSSAVSITSIESEQYSELPTVVQVRPKKGEPVTSSAMTSSRSTLDDVKARASARNSELTKPILRGSKPRGTADERILCNNKRVDKSRDRSFKNTPPLPAKTNVNNTRKVHSTGYT